MIRAIFAYLLALAVTVTSFSLAYARGENPDLANALDMVICTGAGMVTVTIGPDGEPVESVHLCPDGTSIFAASFVMPSVDLPEKRVVARIVPSRAVASSGRDELTPSARGPPALV